jgi:hypothetical protein
LWRTDVLHGFHDGIQGLPTKIGRSSTACTNEARRNVCIFFTSGAIASAATAEMLIICMARSPIKGEKQTTLHFDKIDALIQRKTERASFRGITKPGYVHD